MTKKQLQEQIDNQKLRIDKLESRHAGQRAISDERWQMLKTYLGIKEEHYAELASTTVFVGVRKFEMIKQPIKKTRLVKIKNK